MITLNLIKKTKQRTLLFSKELSNDFSNLSYLYYYLFNIYIDEY